MLMKENLYLSHTHRIKTYKKQVRIQCIFIMSASSVCMSLIVDCREKDCIEMMREMHPECVFVTQSIELGDFQLRDAENQDIRVIVERKTIKDLAQSIKDGRFTEQKKRLQDYRKTNPHVIILFVIEGGNIDFIEDQMIDNMPMKSIYTCLFHLPLREKMQIFCTKDVQSTCRFVRALHDRCQKHWDVYHPQCNFHTSHQDYLSNTGHLNSKKKAQVSKEDTYYLQLACLPGISIRKAQDIGRHTETRCMKELCDKINVLGFDRVFADISGIGKKTREIMAEYILSKNM